MWLSRNFRWNINRKNTNYGSSALNLTLFMGPRKLDLVKYLVEDHGASLLSVNDGGYTALTLACENDDADPKVIQYLLQSSVVNVNQKVVAKTLTLKMVRTISSLGIRSGISIPKVLQVITEEGGMAALHYAARRGDMEIVELLLEHGAKPSIKNDLGRDVLS